MECKRVYRDERTKIGFVADDDRKKSITLSQEIYWLEAYHVFWNATRNKRIFNIM